MKQPGAITKAIASHLQPNRCASHGPNGARKQVFPKQIDIDAEEETELNREEGEGCLLITTL